MIKVNGDTVYCEGKGKELLTDYVRVTLAVKKILGNEFVKDVVNLVANDLISYTEVELDLEGLKHEDSV